MLTLLYLIKSILWFDTTHNCRLELDILMSFILFAYVGMCSRKTRNALLVENDLAIIISFVVDMQVYLNRGLCNIYEE